MDAKPIFIKTTQIRRDDKDKITDKFLTIINLVHVKRITLLKDTVIDPVNNIISAEIEFSTTPNLNKKEELIDDYIEVGVNEERLIKLLKLTNTLYEIQ